MRNQHPGQPQPRPGQQQGLNDRQSWEQHLMYKQLQEIQRQRHLQQLDPGGRQQHSFTQLSDVARQGGIRPSLPVLSGMPINNASNYPWAGQITGGEPKTTSSPHMFFAGNMSQRNGPPMHGMSSGPMFSHDQGQTLRPVSFVQQHGDQSLYGTPVSSTRYSNHLSQSQGMSHGFTEVPNRTGGDPSEKGIMQPSAINYFQSNQAVVPEHSYVKESISVPNQGFQGKGLFGNTPVHNLNSGDMLGNFQQVDKFSGSVHVQEFQGMHDRDNWSGKLQENRSSQVGPSRCMANLDPTEEKILFGTENDNNWVGSSGNNTNKETAGNRPASSVQNNDQFSAFPSTQSGSWSALMLDALDASSSDTGLQEEWSGSSLQKTEPSMRNHFAFLNDNGKQKRSCDENNPQSASSLPSRPLPLFNDADGNPNQRMFPTFPHSTEFAYQQNEPFQPDVSNESSQHSSKDANNKQSDQDRQRKQFTGANIHGQALFDNTSNGAWAGQLYGPSASARNSADMEFNMQNKQLVWDHQQKMHMQNVSSLSIDKSNGWNINQSPGGDSTSNIPDNDRPEGHAQQMDAKKTMHMERDSEGGVWRGRGNQVATFPKPSGRHEVESDTDSPRMRREDHTMGNHAAAENSDASEMNQQVKQQAYHQNHLAHGLHATNDSSKDYKGAENTARYQNQFRRNQQARDSSMYAPEKNEVGEIFDHSRDVSNPGDNPNESYISSHSHHSQHTDSDGGSRENSLLAGNDSGPLVSSRQKPSGQAGRKNVGPRKFQYHPMGNLEIDLEPTDSRVTPLHSQGPNHSVVRGPKNQDQGHIGRSEFHSQVVPGSAMHLRKEHLTDLQRNMKASDEAQVSGTLLGHDSQNKPVGQPSHNMLELLHKVDQSRNNNTVAHFSLSDQNRLSEIHNSTPDGSVRLQHDHSSNMQGYGLKLAPPSQRQPISGHDLASQTSSAESMPLAGQVTKNENLDNRSNMYGKINRQGIRVNPSEFTGHTLPYARDRSTVQQQQWQQQQWQHQRHLPSVTGSSPMGQCANLSVGSQVNTDPRVKSFSQPRPAQGSNDGNLSVQPAQGSLRSVASPAPPPRFNPSGETCAPAASQFHSLNSGPAEPPNSSSLPRSSGQLPSGATAQPATTTGMPQQGGFSSMLHKVLSGISAQRLPMTQAQKIIPRMPHSAGPLPSSTTQNLWSPQKAEDHTNKAEGSTPSEFGTCSTNSQKSIYVEEYPMVGQSSQNPPFKKMDSTPKTSDGSRGQEPISVPSLVQLHHQELGRRKHAHESSLDSQKEHGSIPNADAQNQNYSLMKQVQTMKGSDSDPSKRAGKRLRGTNFGADVAQNEGPAGQNFIYGQNTAYRELDAATQHSSFPSDVKMLSFSRETEDESANTPSQLREKLPEDLLNSIQKNLHNHPLSEVSRLALARGDKRPQINSQGAPSWYDLYRPCKNGQGIASNDGTGNSQTSTQVPERMDSIVMEQKVDTTQNDAPIESAVSTAMAANENSSSFSPPPVIDNNAVLIPKKRKTRTLELLPWHKEVTQGSQRQLNISLAERDWAKAANMLIEKVDDGLVMIEVGSPMTPARRRLILTTQLMQLLLPSVPATFLRADASASYESVAYSVAKSALGDASSVVSCSGRNSEKLESSEEKDHFLFEKIEGFIGRAKTLDGDLLRSERTTSVLDVRVECHDLDRCSIINRLAKFHGRAQMDGTGADTSSVSEIATRRIFPQRQVTAQAASSKLPEDIKCHLL